MQNDTPDSGQLLIRVNSSLNNFPISGATVSISVTGGDGQPLEQLDTDTSGQTEEITLRTPPIDYSMEPGGPRPYSEFNITVSAPGYEPQVVDGTEVLPESTALQTIRLRPLSDNEGVPSPIIIPDHTLYGEYPPKIAEPEVKPIAETGNIVLSRVVVPETIVVHDGTISNTSAPNYYVPYKDYIKNVASSEIYANWPESTITANVLAIMSFTMNRVYTEWYRNKGYDFTITSSTAYDHKWIYGRNYFESISVIVDDIFTNYLSRPDVKQPILTQYCDGQRVTCPEWMSQWGSRSLGEQGYSPIEILRYYYGQDMYINTAEQISGIPSSWPGSDLTIGSTGPKVQQLQEQLNSIASIYSAIPSITPDGIYGESTKNAVEAFQNVFGLPQTGVVDFRTWYKVSEIYVGISRIAELN
ncbi:peptidoglycan-binding protein [Qiania dongpingensis]|uniref:Peptidoglycan-binding protein n=1 Tax=Qiania dongpingensis TaxID=2763669 RepID=A0A7G9G803_9FIRM|nr:peptidoglycan-binding protein [Qiania dongpingensis]QNM06935.1 peptidoglycan-binding protein [Qiania dongpingensis]